MHLAADADEAVRPMVDGGGARRRHAAQDQRVLQPGQRRDVLALLARRMLRHLLLEPPAELRRLVLGVREARVDQDVVGHRPALDRPLPRADGAVPDGVVRVQRPRDHGRPERVGRARLVVRVHGLDAELAVAEEVGGPLLLSRPPRRHDAGANRSIDAAVHRCYV
jgi:hypothetical protein